MTNLISITLLTVGFLGMWVCALYVVDYLFSFVEGHLKMEEDDYGL